MDISVFLSKAFGLYLLIVGTGMLINPKIKLMFEDIMNDPPLVYVTDFIGLILGILMITIHNVWEADWRLIITLIGWLMLIRGTVRIVFPQLGNEIILKWVQCSAAYYTTIVIMLAAGAILYYTGCVHGYMPVPLSAGS